MQNILWFILAAACEIAGCDAGMWLRLGRSAWWLAPGTVSLLIFALALTRVDSAFAGRAFAAYGGGYISCLLRDGRPPESRSATNEASGESFVSTTLVRFS